MDNRDNDDMLFLGKRIREARKNAGYTQEQLAELLGISRSAIARYERGDIEPSIQNLIAMSNCLKVSADYILGITEMRTHDGIGLTREERETLIKLSKEINKLLEK